DVVLVALAVLSAALARLPTDDGQRERRGLLPLAPNVGCQAHRRSTEERLSQELPPMNRIAHDHPPSSPGEPELPDDSSWGLTLLACLVRAVRPRFVLG